MSDKKKEDNVHKRNVISWVIVLPGVLVREALQKRQAWIFQIQ
jgi:hypothetical protein